LRPLLPPRGSRAERTVGKVDRERATINSQRPLALSTEDREQETPDGGDGIEQSVAIRDGVLVEGLEDAPFAQGVGEGKSLVAREASADLLQGGHGGSQILGWQ